MSATATWEIAGTRSDSESARNLLRKLAVDSTTAPVSSTAQSEVGGVVRGRWEAITGYTRLQREGIRNAGILWLVWSQGGRQVEGDPVTVAATLGQPKQDLAKSLLRQWLLVSDRERARQNENLAVLVDELNAERGAGREVFR